MIKSFTSQKENDLYTACVHLWTASVSYAPVLPFSRYCIICIGSNFDWLTPYSSLPSSLHISYDVNYIRSKASTWSSLIPFLVTWPSTRNSDIGWTSWSWSRWRWFPLYVLCRSRNIRIVSHRAWPTHFDQSASLVNLPVHHKSVQFSDGSTGLCGLVSSFQGPNSRDPKTKFWFLYIFQNSNY